MMRHPLVPAKAGTQSWIPAYAGMSGIVLRPVHHRQHRGEDGVDIAAGAQAENGAAVIEQIELDIAAAAHQLFLALGFGPRFCEILSYQFRIDAEESAADVLSEGKRRIPIGLEIIVKDPADAAHFIAVLEKEIFVAPLFEFFVGCNAAMRVARGSHRGMK